MADTSAVDWFARSLAVIGTALGVWNTCVAHYRNRVRLRVTPKRYAQTPNGMLYSFSGKEKDADRFGQGARGFCVEVVNLSPFPVTIDDVGFLDVNGDRLAITIPITTDDSPWPCRLESHSGKTFYAQLGTPAESQLARMKCAYATTASDAIFTGVSEAFTEAVDRAKTLAKNKAA